MFSQVEISKVATVKGGKRLPDGHGFSPLPTDHPYIRARDIRDGRVTFDDPVYLTPETHAQISQYTVSAGDVCVTIVGANVGDIGCVPSNLDGANLTENAVKFVCHQGIEPAFLKYCLLTDHLQKAMKRIAAGAAQPKLGIYKLNSLKIPLPGMTTQRRIVAILSAYDDLIENNRRRMVLLEEAMHLLYLEWFVRVRFPGHEQTPVTNGVPDGWCAMPLGDAITLQRGFDLPAGERQPGDVPVYASTGVVGTHNTPKAAGPGVVTGRSGSLGTVIYVPRDYWPLNTTLWVKEFKCVTVEYGYFLLHHFDLTRYQGGAAVPTLNRNAVHAATVIIPPQSLQHDFGEIVTPMLRQITTLDMQNAALREARNLLLPRLMNGSITV